MCEKQDYVKITSSVSRYAASGKQILSEQYCRLHHMRAGRNGSRIKKEEGIMVNRFVLNAVSYHGKGAVQEIPGIIESKGLQKAFIATDPDLVEYICLEVQYLDVLVYKEYEY